MTKMIHFYNKIEDLEPAINLWLSNVMPIINYVTHVVHANTHHITVWYMTGEKK